ncbi:MAG: RNA polymerase sigma factor [Acidimicrobiales bacterium]
MRSAATGPRPANRAGGHPGRGATSASPPTCRPTSKWLLRVARTLTPNHPDAADSVQGTLVRAFRGIDGFDRAHPRAW